MRRLAIVVLAMACVPAACTSPEDKFCGKLRDDYKLTELVTAISQRDQRRITEGLERLRELQDDAPAEIHDDFRKVVDAVTGAVRAVTRAPGTDGDKLPVDLTKLRLQVGESRQAAQHIADYADSNCGLRLNP